MRERLGAEIRRGAGVVTLTGPSGIGKTRLARQVAGELLDIFDDEGGIWFCGLADCRDVFDLEAAVARTLEIQQQGEGLARSLANRGPLLLILDNADPIADRIGETLESWLERCVELQIILTSLVPTGIEAEIVLELHPLEPDESVALYLDRARRAWADRSFSGEELVEIQDLVRRLDRHPLAIELAAARVRLLPPRAMLGMLEKRFQLLRTSSMHRAPGFEALEPKGSLISALELTWSHLPPAEQLALARAAVFEGGFDLFAARAVLESGSDELEASPRRELDWLLDELRRKALLVVEETEPVRYFLLESVREYAIGELRRMGRCAEAIQRHAAYFLDHEHAQPQLSTVPRHADSIRWLKNERANLVAIHHRFLETVPSLAARAGIALAPLINNQGHASSDSNLIAATLDGARRSQDPKLLLAALEAAYTAHFRFGRFDEAKAAMVEQAELARKLGEKMIETLTLSLLAIVHIDQGELESSHSPLQRAIRLSEEVGSPQVEAVTLLAQGIEAIERGAHDEAEARLTRSVLLLRSHGNRGSEVKSLHSLGLTLAKQGRHLEARQAMQAAIDACRGMRHPYFEAAFLSNLADIDLAAGLLDEAEAAGRQSLGIYRKLGNRFREGEVICSLGIISLERGDLDAAAEQLARAEELLGESGATGMRIEALSFLAVLESKRGRREEAKWILYEIQAYRGAGEDKLNPLFAEGALAFFEVATARQHRASNRQEVEARVQRVRVRLAAIKREDVRTLSYLPVLARLLERELAELDAGRPAPTYSTSLPALTFGAGLDWVQPPGAQRINLHHRRVLRAVFAALAKARLESPGLPVNASDLIKAGWPGTEPTGDGTTNRLQVAIWTLRDLGLRNVVQNAPTGYLLDPTVPIHVES